MAENQFPEYDKYLDGDEEVIVKRSKLNRDIEPKPVEKVDVDVFEEKKQPPKPPVKKPMEDISSKSNKSDKKLKIGLGILCGVTGVFEVIAVVMLAMVGILPTAFSI